MAAAACRFPVSRPVLTGNEKEYVLHALEGGWVSSAGAFVGRFEQAVSSFLGLEEGLAVNSGTAALHLACQALGLKAGMDVVVPALTFVASANAVRYCGARPVFADSDPHTWNVTPASVAAAWTERTVGVLLVHLYGLPAPAAEIAALCRRRGAWLIEDCAQAFGAGVGGHGDAAAFSFFGNKIVSTGEGGMVFVRDPRRRRLAHMLRGHGMDPRRRYWHPVLGHNYRLSNLAAAVGLGQVEQAEHHLAERHRIARRYRRNLEALAHRELLRLPAEPPGVRNVHWLFSAVLASGGRTARDRIAAVLLRQGIETRPFFVPLHRLPPHRDPRRLPVAERLGDHGLNLPTYTGLADEDVDTISAAFAEAVLDELSTSARRPVRARAAS